MQKTLFKQIASHNTFKEVKLHVIVMEIVRLQLCVVIILGICFYAIVRLRLRSTVNTLPGPRFRIPIFGHLLLLGTQPWLTLKRWQKYYGKMFCIYLGSNRCIVLNDASLIKEAFHKKSLANRFKVNILAEAAEGRDISIMGDGKFALEQRDFVIKCFKDLGCRPTQIEHQIHIEISKIIRKLESKLEQPVTMNHFFGTHLLAALWNVFMGQELDENDSSLHELEILMRRVFQSDGTLIGLAPFIPWISKLVPEYSGYNSKVRTTRRVCKLMQEAYDKPLAPGRVQGQPRNFIEAFLDKEEAEVDNVFSSFHPSHKIFAQTAAGVFFAASDTVSVSMEWFVLYMAAFPTVQKKLQEEIDDKIGNSRHPYISDRAAMPYSIACINELLRFSSITPLNGGMHRASEDTTLNSYKIIKDTHVMANTYAVHFDKEFWGDPHNFRPERFFEENQQSLRDNVLAFSIGGRNCIGEALGRDKLFLAATGIFQKFNVSCCGPIQLLHDSVPGNIRAPKKFDVVFSKR